MLLLSVDDSVKIDEILIGNGIIYFAYHSTPFRSVYNRQNIHTYTILPYSHSWAHISFCSHKTDKSHTHWYLYCVRNSLVKFIRYICWFEETKNSGTKFIKRNGRRELLGGIQWFLLQNYKASYIRVNHLRSLATRNCFFIIRKIVACNSLSLLLLSGTGR